MLFLDDNLQHTAYDSRIFNQALCDTARRVGISNVLVLGGGSGQTVLTLLEFPTIEHITVVEIDPLVIECCRRYIKGVNRAFNDSRVQVVIADAACYVHSTNKEFDGSIIDFTEKPFGETSSTALRQLYSEIKEKCKGRCSQYVGSSVGLAYSQRRKNLMDNVCRRVFSSVRYVDVFIPSFGAPHTFMHAGYEE